MNTKTFVHRTASILMIAMLLFAALPVATAGATSLNITSVASGTWEATAWPNTLRSGTISVTAGNTTVTGTGTSFLTELSVGNILKTTGNVQIGTVASIASNTSLTLANIPATSRTNIAYNVQGVGPADNVTIANTHTVTVAARAINQTGTVTVNSGGTLIVSNAGAVFSTLIVSGTLNGTAGNALGALTVNSGGTVNAGSNGAYTASSLTINSGGTMNISRSFTVSGATSITGTVTFSSNTVTSRAMLFNGAVTLNSGAVWSEATSGNGANNTYNFQDNLTNNAATFTSSDTSPHTFSGASKTISGSTTTSIARVAMPGSYTNNGTLSIGTILSGAGSLTNGASGTLSLNGTVSIATLSNAGTMNKTNGGPITTALANFTNTGTLNLSGTGTIAGITNSTGGIVNLNNSGSITAFNNATATSVLNILDLTVPHFGTLTVSVAGNTVNYGGAGDQTVKRITYDNLVFSGTGTKSITMPNSSTLANGNLSIAPTGTAIASVTGPNLSVNHLSIAGAGKAAGTWGSSSSAATNTDDTYFAATAGYLNVTNDTRSPQTISFTSPAPEDAEIGGTYTPTAQATSTLPVTFTIDASSTGICSISLGVVSFDANGTCVIDADQAGDLTFLAASQQQSFDIKIGQTINFTSTAPVSAQVGETYTPTATATSGLSVDISIDASASSVCSISAGLVSFDAVGTCVINANQDGDNDYHPAPQAQQSFSVGKGAQSINFTSTAPTAALVGIGTYTPTATATSDLTVAFTIDASATSVCSISGGIVSFLAAGTCVINANQAGDSNYDAASQQQQSFTVGNTVVSLGGVPQASYNLALHGNVRPSYAGVDKGPVKITSVTGLPIVASMRVAYSPDGGTTWTSHSEMMGLPANQVSTSYTFPWYNNVDINSQLRFGNVGNANTTVTVTIGGVVKGNYSVLPNKSVRISYPGLNSGPVKVVSSANVPIIASMRVAYTPDNGVTWPSFSEMMGLPSAKLTTSYTFPYYNNVDLNTQLRFGNVGTASTTVTVRVGGVVKGTYNLGINQSTRVSYPGLNAGPVVVTSSGNVPIIASMRVAYFDGTLHKWTDFSEMMGMPTSSLSTSYSFPVYNNVDHNSQLRFGNVGTTSTTVTVTVGGVLKGSYPLAPNQSLRIPYAGLNDGPVVIQSSGGVKIIASERVAYFDTNISKWTSFAEMMGLPKEQLTTSYLFPWYNNLLLDTQLRFGAP